MNVAEKVCVVTGAGSGIGRELAVQLSARNAKVVAIDYNAESLSETMSLLSGGPETHLELVLNVADSEKVAESVERVIEVFGTVDALINNAGISQPIVPATSLTLSQIHRVFDVNWFGVVYMTMAYLPHLRTGGKARLVNISSLGAFASVPTQVVYSASKAAVNMFTQGLMSELHDTNVGITVVYPGAIDTNITLNSPGMSSSEKAQHIEAQKGFIEKYATSAHEAARQVLNAIESDKERLYIGNDSKLISLLSRISPRLTAGLIRSQLRKALPSDSQA